MEKSILSRFLNVFEDLSSLVQYITRKVRQNRIKALKEKLRRAKQSQNPKEKASLLSQVLTNIINK